MDPKIGALFRRFTIPKEGIDEFFDPPLESKYKCPKCLLGLREPVQTECGHHFCRDCLVWALSEYGNKCPIDGIPLSEYGFYPDKFIEREMRSLTVWCRQHKERGCSWKGALSELKVHLITCPFSDVTCPNKCGAVVQPNDIEEHLNLCPKRKILCDCEKMILFTEMKSHLDNCPKYKITCPKCKEIVANEELAKHREKVCPKEKIKWPPLYFFGRKQEDFIPEIPKDISVNIVSHIQDLAKTVNELQVQVNEVEKSSKNFKKIRGGEMSAAPSSNYSEERMYEGAILFEPDLEKLSEQMKSLENRVTDLEGRVCSGTFIWKIENYEQCRTQARNNMVRSIHSPPFYTGLYGYKMCLRMNLFGVDSGVGGHVSLFVHMVQGDWDGILEWPFTGRITLSILDQSENVEFHRPISKTLVAKPNLLAFQKPTTHRNRTEEYGYVEFCQINQLVPGQFVKNNLMLVRIQVFH